MRWDKLCAFIGRRKFIFSETYGFSPVRSFVRPFVRSSVRSLILKSSERISMKLGTIVLWVIAQIIAGPFF